MKLGKVKNILTITKPSEQKTPAPVAQPEQERKVPTLIK